MSDFSGIENVCPHCGAPGREVLGRCEVCRLTVCTGCGNTQHRGGKKIVVHDACLGDLGDDGFSMIKFVK
ncbi:MAG: hypothetical protein Kow0056_14370 [Coriobacteriia bacterium]